MSYPINILLALKLSVDNSDHIASKQLLKLFVDSNIDDAKAKSLLSKTVNLLQPKARAWLKNLY